MTETRKPFPVCAYINILQDRFSAVPWDLVKSRTQPRPEAIQHIVLTHLHFDHAGGLPDFPRARVRLHRWEFEAMRHPKKWIGLFAQDPSDFAHHPKWVLYDEPSEKWFDFEAIPLPFSPRVYLIPLFGHTSGPCGVAIEDGAGSLFQAADSLPLNAQFDLTPGWVNLLVPGPHIPRLRGFMAEHPEVRVLAAHNWRKFFKQTKQ